MSILKDAQDNFKNDWVSHLGNRMTPKERNDFIEEMERIVNNPQDPLEYIISALVKQLKEMK